jgi:Chaperone of endosialidase
MAVPYTFGSATASIPLSQLDSNFATTITLGNVAVQLGNTVTSLTGVTNVASATSLTLGSNGNTTAVTIDASQNVLIGSSVTAKNNAPGVTVKTAQQGFIVYNGAGSTYNELGVWDGASDTLKAVIKAEGGIAKFGSRTNSNVGIQVNDSVVATFDTSGNLLVGTTSLTGSVAGISVANSGANVQALTTNSTSSSSYYIGRFYSGGVEKGYIYYNGTTVAFTSTSDYRLKENVQPMTGALEKVAQLKPCTYTWKENGVDGQGFIAHELQAVVPDCVTGEKDAVNEDGSIKPQGIDTSFLVATLTAAIQEQNQLITSLTERITALEAK